MSSYLKTHCGWKKDIYSTLIYLKKAKYFSQTAAEKKLTLFSSLKDFAQSLFAFDKSADGNNILFSELWIYILYQHLGHKLFHTSTQWVPNKLTTLKINCHINISPFISFSFFC